VTARVTTFDQPAGFAIRETLQHARFDSLSEKTSMLHTLAGAQLLTVCRVTIHDYNMDNDSATRSPNSAVLTILMPVPGLDKSEVE